MDNPARTSDDRLDRLLRGTLPGEFSFFGRQQEQSPPLPTALEPGRVIGDFRLITLIGQGGMGQVWEAEQTTLERRVALKLVRPDRVNEHTLDLFAREARAGGRLHHPGIVTVHGHGEHEGLAWISMELVEGSWTLHDFLQDASKQDELPGDYYRQVAEFMARLAEALHTAHEAGVIHRDLKPRNVLITSDEQPKVSDFGLAKITDETAISQTGEFAGTYYYMSPEQAMAKRMGIDHRTDIFSLGVVMYEMLALRRPFEGDTTQQIVRQIMLEDPVDPRRLRSRVPRDLAVISGKCLEKNPDRRFQTMAELAADIRRHLAHEPILAKPPTAWQRGVKWLQRHPTTSGIAAVGTAALVVISFLLAANVRANEDLRTASETITRERNNLAAANQALQGEIESVKRLSALQDHDDLMAEVDELWPPYPESIDAYRKWIAETQELVDELPLHHAKREELRAMALPLPAGERKAEREKHPDFPRLEALAGKISARRRALLQRRDGVRVELPELDFGSLPQDSAKLNALARPLVDPERAVFGREAEGLVLADKALELAQAALDDMLVATAGDTAAWAFFAVGRDEEALEASGVALEVAPEEKREEYEGYLSDLEGWVEKQRSEEGTQIAEEELAQLAAEREELEAAVNERQEWAFPDTEEGRAARWWHANLTKLIGALEALTAAGTGLLLDAEGAVSAEHGWSVVRRLAFAQRSSAGFAPGGEFRVRWEQDLPGIRGAYPGLELVVQLGLVPIGADPQSGLWEFWHVPSGTEPLGVRTGSWSWRRARVSCSCCYRVGSSGWGRSARTRRSRTMIPRR